MDDDCPSDSESIASECSATCIVVSGEHRCHPHDVDKTVNRMPVIGSSCLLPEDKLAFHNLPLEKGHINGKVVTVLRDTGCTSAIVKRGLITDKQLTGERRMYLSVDRTARFAPIAQIFVETPFYTGIIDAMCLEDPICDLIIGNLKAVVNQDSDMMHEHVNQAKKNLRKKIPKAAKPNLKNTNRTARKNSDVTAGARNNKPNISSAVVTQNIAKKSKKIKELRYCLERILRCGVGD